MQCCTESLHFTRVSSSILRIVYVTSSCRISTVLMQREAHIEPTLFLTCWNALHAGFIYGDDQQVRHATLRRYI
jgi:hypothetical protein